jgi:hypothetical protein
MAVEADEAQYDAFLEKYVYGVSNFAEYLDLCGGESRISALRAQELNAGDA